MRKQLPRRLFHNIVAVVAKRMSSSSSSSVAANTISASTSINPSESRVHVFEEYAMPSPALYDPNHPTNLRFKKNAVLKLQSFNQTFGRNGKMVRLPSEFVERGAAPTNMVAGIPTPTGRSMLRQHQIQLIRSGKFRRAVLEKSQDTNGDTLYLVREPKLLLLGLQEVHRVQRWVRNAFMYSKMLNSGQGNKVTSVNDDDENVQQQRKKVHRCKLVLLNKDRRRIGSAVAQELDGFVSRVRDHLLQQQQGLPVSEQQREFQRFAMVGLQLCRYCELLRIPVGPNSLILFIDLITAKTLPTTLQQQPTNNGLRPPSSHYESLLTPNVVGVLVLSWFASGGREVYRASGAARQCCVLLRRIAECLVVTCEKEKLHHAASAEIPGSLLGASPAHVLTQWCDAVRSVEEQFLSLGDQQKKAEKDDEIQNFMSTAFPKMSHRVKADLVALVSLTLYPYNKDDKSSSMASIEHQQRLFRKYRQLKFQSLLKKSHETLPRGVLPEPPLVVGVQQLRQLRPLKALGYVADATRSRNSQLNSESVTHAILALCLCIAAEPQHRGNQGFSYFLASTNILSALVNSPSPAMLQRRSLTVIDRNSRSEDSCFHTIRNRPSCLLVHRAVQLYSWSRGDRDLNRNSQEPYAVVEVAMEELASALDTVLLNCFRELQKVKDTKHHPLLVEQVNVAKGSVDSSSKDHELGQETLLSFLVALADMDCCGFLHASSMFQSNSRSLRELYSVLYVLIEPQAIRLVAEFELQEEVMEAWKAMNRALGKPEWEMIHFFKKE